MLHISTIEKVEKEAEEEEEKGGGGGGGKKETRFPFKERVKRRVLRSQRQSFRRSVLDSLLS